MRILREETLRFGIFFSSNIRLSYGRDRSPNKVKKKEKRVTDQKKEEKKNSFKQKNKTLRNQVDGEQH